MPHLVTACIIHAGYLWKSPPLEKPKRKLARWKYRWFVLYDTINIQDIEQKRELELIYYEKDEIEEKGGKYIGTIDLLQASKIYVSAKPIHGFPLSLCIKTKKRTWYLCSRNYQSFTDWVDVIKNRTDCFCVDEKIQNEPLSTTSKQSLIVPRMQRSASFSTTTSSMYRREQLTATDIDFLICHPALYKSETMSTVTTDEDGGGGSGGGGGGKKKLAPQRSRTLSSLHPAEKPSFFQSIGRRFTSRLKRPTIPQIEEEGQQNEHSPGNDGNTPGSPSSSTSSGSSFVVLKYDPFDKPFNGPTLSSTINKSRERLYTYDSSQIILGHTPQDSFTESFDLSDFRGSASTSINGSIFTNDEDSVVIYEEYETDNDVFETSTGRQDFIMMRKPPALPERNCCDKRENVSEKAGESRTEPNKETKNISSDERRDDVDERDIVGEKNNNSASIDVENDCFKEYFGEFMASRNKNDSLSTEEESNGKENVTENVGETVGENNGDNGGENVAENVAENIGESTMIELTNNDKSVSIDGKQKHIESTITGFATININDEETNHNVREIVGEITKNSNDDEEKIDIDVPQSHDKIISSSKPYKFDFASLLRRTADERWRGKNPVHPTTLRKQSSLDGLRFTDLKGSVAKKIYKVYVSFSADNLTDI